MKRVLSLTICVVMLTVSLAAHADRRIEMPSFVQVAIESINKKARVRKINSVAAFEHRVHELTTSYYGDLTIDCDAKLRTITSFVFGGGQDTEKLTNFMDKSSANEQLQAMVAFITQGAMSCDGRVARRFVRVQLGAGNSFTFTEVSEVQFENLK